MMRGMRADEGGCGRGRGRLLAGAALLAVFLALPAGAGAAAVAAERDARPETPVLASGARDRTELDVTIYNSNLGLVRDVRRLELPAGAFALEFRDVPAQIDPRSLLVETAGGATFEIREQNYEFDLMSRQKILEKYVGERIAWIQEDGERIVGRLLGMAEGPVYEVDGEIVFDVPGRIVLPDLPRDLRARPTLVWSAASRRGGEATLQASYLTGGMGWSADYVLQLDPSGKSGDLQSWVSLQNQSGATFDDARLLLVAGDVHRVRPPVPRMLAEAKMAFEGAADMVTEQALYDYHMYTLPGRTTLKDNQTKQVALFSAADIAIERAYRLEGGGPIWFQGGGPVRQDEKVQVFYAFLNEERNGLGRPLPAGTFRVYGVAGDGSRALLGEDAIDHTPKDERIELQVGAAFDLVAERERKDFRRISDRVSETEYEVTLRNHKDEAVEVEVIEHVGGDWRLLSHSHPYEKLSAERLRFRVPVPADGETVLTYRIQVQY